MKYPSVGKSIIITIMGTYIYFKIIPILVLANQKPHTQFLTATSKNVNMIPFYWMVVIVGGCIAVTLTYVSWRKYKGEKKKQIKKDSNS